MPKKGITGHDGWVITEALATALIALAQLPPQHQPRAHMDDIRKLLSAPGAITGIATSRRAASDVCAGKLSAVGAGFGSCCPAVVRWRPQFAARVVGSR